MIIGITRQDIDFDILKEACYDLFEQKKYEYVVSVILIKFDLVHLYNGVDLDYIYYEIENKYYGNSGWIPIVY